MVSTAMIEHWRRQKDVAVYFTDGSALCNPGPAASAALRVFPFSTPLPKENKGHTKDNTKNDKNTKTSQQKTTQSKQKSLYENQNDYDWCTTQSFVKETNNVAELEAVGLAMTHAATDSQRVLVHILSDSRYAKGMLQDKFTPKKNVELVQRLRAQWKTLEARGWKLEMHWTRAHNVKSLKWNKLVDKLALAAARSLVAKESMAASTSVAAASKTSVPSVDASVAK